MYFLASSLHFTMKDMEAVVPVLNRENKTKDLILLQAIEGENLSYSVQYVDEESNELLQENFNEPNGKISINTALGWKNISVRVTARNNMGEKAITNLKIFLVSKSTCDDEALRSVCFWKNSTYQVKKKSKSNYLGTLAPQSSIGGCSVRNISYKILTGLDIVKLYPPELDNIKLWTIRTLKDIIKHTPASKFNFTISCLLETSKATYNFTNPIEVDILEANNCNFPQPQDEHVTFSYKNIISKNSDRDKMIFLHNSNGTQYHPFINDTEVAKLLEPICTYKDDSRHHSLTAKIIICHLKSKKFKKSLDGDLTFFVGLKSLDSKSEDKCKTGFIKVTLTSSKKPKEVDSQSIFFFNNSTKIFRTAAPYARVTQPNIKNKNTKDYNITVLNKITSDALFEITTEGIVFVSDFLALRKAPEYLRVNITWLNKGILKNQIVYIRVIDEPTLTCKEDFLSSVNNWTYCSQFKNKKSCVRPTNCALGTGGITSVEKRTDLGLQRCMWRGDSNPENHETHIYSTCTSDTTYCPNGECDSLEALVEEELCPQDCTKKNPAFPTKLNPDTNQGIDKCNGILICDYSGCVCDIKPIGKLSAEPLGHKKSKETKICGLWCMIGTTGGIVLILLVIFSAVIFWRITYLKKLTKTKCIGSMQEAETPFSDYIDRNTISEPMVLNFHMSTTLESSLSNSNTLKLNKVDQRWEFPRHHIIIEQILGEGEFGKVLKAKAYNIAGRPGYSTVALKTLKDDARRQDYNDLVSEYQLLKEVNHPHVIELLGVCSNDDGPLYVIIEYAKYGSLRNYLRQSRHVINNRPVEANEDYVNENVTPRQILSFARQIASGMAYLSSIKLVHRDLAARNILLAENMVCKISDFGLTRDIYEDNAYFKKSKGRVPVKWMAPESLADHVYTTKSDVWSFGILVWELITLGATPYPGLAVHSLYNLLRQGYRMEKPQNCSTVLYSLMEKCWKMDPEERPSFMELFHALDNLLTDNISYLNLLDNAIINKTYFVPETESDNTSSSNEEVRSEGKMLNITDEPQEAENSVDYETPVKAVRKVAIAESDNSGKYTVMQHLK